MQAKPFSVGFRTVQYDYQVSEPSAFNIPETLNHKEQYLNASLFYQLTGRTHCDRIVVFEGNPRQIGHTLPVIIYDANGNFIAR